MNANDDRDPFRGLRAPRAPAELRQRVLRAAAAAVEPDPPIGIWDRLWESRTIGRAWVSVTLGLLVAHAGLSLVPKTPPAEADPRSIDRRLARETQELLDMPSVEISARAEKLALGGRSRSKRPRPSDESNTETRS